jgi:hypothetical protein
VCASSAHVFLDVERIFETHSGYWVVEKFGQAGVAAWSGLTRAGGHTIRYVLFYGVASAQTEKAVEFFLEREAAEAMIGEVREDEPELAEELRVEAIELG